MMWVARRSFGSVASRCSSWKVKHFCASAPAPRKFDNNYRAFLLDMDGVLHQFGKPIDGASTFMENLISNKIPFAVITNECRYTKEGLQQKLANILGVEIPTSQIYSAATSVGEYFGYQVKTGWRGNVFAIGEEGILQAINDALSGTPCEVFTNKSDMDDSVHCDFVCIGTVQTGGPNDSWTSAEKASNYLRKGAKLVYSNPDYFEVTSAGDYKFGCPMPVVELLMQTTGCSSYNLGKPNPWMLRQAHKQMTHAVLSPLSETQRAFVSGNIDLEYVLFVGDSIGTDVRTAVENGIDVALVMSGTTTPEALKKSALQPHFVFNSIEDLHHAYVDGRLLRGHRNHHV